MHIEDVYDFIIWGLCYGDEGKGTIVEYLTKKYRDAGCAVVICRFNGGAQAAHHVITEKNIFHCYSQFGSGTLAGAMTILLDKMLVDPIRMISEAEALKEKGIANPLNLVCINPDCLITTPFHAIINQMKEISRGENRQGSCGVGVGETVRDGRQLGNMALRAKDMFSKETLRSKLSFIYHIKVDLAEQLLDEQPDNTELSQKLESLKQKERLESLIDLYYDFAVNSGVRIKNIEQNIPERAIRIYEGAQGAMLDEERGLYPFITPSRTTPQNAEEYISHFDCAKKVVKIGIMRAYVTRHGKGFLITEDNWLGKQIPDMHNGMNEWQGVFRIGWFDLVTARYALRMVGEIDSVALTNLDRLDKIDEIKVCYAYRYEGEEKGLDQFFEYEKSEEGSFMINEIKFPPTSSKEYQCRLNDLLMSCKPIYKKVEKEEYVRFLESELRVRISIISRGPKASDKIENRPLVLNESMEVKKWGL